MFVPVEVDAETGAILDGHHRAEIAEELGVRYPTKRLRFETEEEKWEHVLFAQLLRRNLGPIAWAEAFEKLLALRGVKRGQGARNGRTSATVAEVAAEAGVPERTARHRLRLKDKLAGHPDLAEKVDRGELPAHEAVGKADERERHRRRDAAPRLPSSVRIEVSDFRKFKVGAGTVDMVFSDPPYRKEFLPLWADLGRFASRVLKPGGVLVTYAAHAFLPRVLNDLAEHLRYVWTVALLLPGPCARMQTYRVRQSWKPLLVYVQGAWKLKEWDWTPDVYTVPAPAKEHHPWEQSVETARHFIELWCPPGGTVCDPLLGSGTTAVAALETGRSFVGCDVDPEAVRVAKQRVGEVAKTRAG